MKPERIQLTASPPRPTLIWGIYQVLQFETFEKATNFSKFVTDMAENHGRTVHCTLDSRHNDVTLFSQADSVGQLAAAQKFVEKVATVFGEWSSPASES